MSEPAAEPLEIVAYTNWGYDVPIIPAFKRRDWMDAAPDRFPYHCLPMVMASIHGWFVLAPHSAVGEWNGGWRPEDLKITVPDPLPPLPGSPPGSPPRVFAESAVGQGILTWTLGHVIRTPPGWNIHCRGPANWIKDGVTPLEGIIETDWSTASFSINWKFTRPGPVAWEKGEPVGMLLPVKRGELERFTCRRAPLTENKELYEGYTKWITQRKAFLAAHKRRDGTAPENKFEKHYFHGQTVEGRAYDDHQKTLHLSPFTDPPEAAGRQQATDLPPPGA